MKQVIKYFFLFCFGGGVYYGIEWAFRQYSHPSMFLLGGICFIICGVFNEILPSELPLPAQMLLCTLSVIWFFMGGIAIIADDYIRYWFFDEEKPSYVFLRKTKEKNKK